MPGNFVLRKQVKDLVDKADEKTLRIIYNLFEMNKQDDWWNEISKQQKTEIKEAVAEADKGKVVPHSEMEKLYRKWLRK
jgi:predicted transcriptional regulator